MFTTKQLAAQFNLPYQTVIGLLTFLKATGACTVADGPAVPNKKGPREKLYSFNQETTLMLACLAEDLTSGSKNIRMAGAGPQVTDAPAEVVTVVETVAA